MKTQEIFENYIFISNGDKWVFEIGENRQEFGVFFEIIDMDEATGDPEFRDYPFLVSASIMAAHPNASFDETNDDEKPTQTSLLYDCNSYMGGVPIDHTLTHSIEELAKAFNPNQACVKSTKANHGTVAAQNGPEHEHQYFQFKTYDDAVEFVELLKNKRCQALGMMIGFILDRPVNMMGERGWSVLEKQVNGIA